VVLLLLLLLVLRGGMKSAPLFDRVNASRVIWNSCRRGQVHTCYKCGKDIHGKIIADELGICVVTRLAGDDSALICKKCSPSNNLVDKSVKTVVKTGEAAFVAALFPSKKPQATGPKHSSALQYGELN